MATSSEHSRIVMENLRRVVQALRQSALQSEKVSGLTGAQALVLRVIGDHQGASMNDLAALTFTHQTTASEIVTKLEARGLVRRERSENDGRKTAVWLTTPGAATLNANPPTANEKLMKAVTTLPPEILAHLAEGLDALTHTAGLTQAPPRMFFEDDQS